MLENELTFLVKKLPKDLKKKTKKREKILQGYLSRGDYPLRIRQKGKVYELTRKIPKKPGDFSCHKEETVHLRKDEFEILWPLTVKYLRKTRYYCSLSGGLITEVDVFEGKLKGLIFVEVEFPDKKSMKSFVPPDWFGRDITQKKWSVNAFLAGKSFNQIKQFLGD